MHSGANSATKTHVQQLAQLESRPHTPRTVFGGPLHSRNPISIPAGPFPGPLTNTGAPLRAGNKVKEAPNRIGAGDCWPWAEVAAAARVIVLVRPGWHLLGATAVVQTVCPAETVCVAKCVRLPSKIRLHFCSGFHTNLSPYFWRKAWTADCMQRVQEGPRKAHSRAWGAHLPALGIVRRRPRRRRWRPRS